MTLPASGAISLNDIATEFGLANSSVFPTAFYGLGGAPSSGALSFSDFYGRSNVVFTPNGGSVSDGGLGGASLTLSCNKSAVWTWTLTTGVAANTGVSVVSGGSALTISFSLVAPGHDSQYAQWAVSGVADGVTRTFTVTLQADAVPA